MEKQKKQLIRIYAGFNYAIKKSYRPETIETNKTFSGTEIS